MSSGESSYMNFFSRLYDVIERYDSGYDDRNNLIVFIDEGEIGYHPAWNKCFLKWVINFLNNYTKKYKFQIILTTHSPYLLSDLTSSNIILLKRGHNGNTEIVPSDKFSTFGANIHELLANSFFLTDGFIGEFAKQNIQWVIDKLNEWRLLKSSNNLIAGQVTGHDKNRVLEIITIIADLIVRNKLFEMYWEIFDEDSALTNEIELLQERIDQLKNRKRDDIN